MCTFFAYNMYDCVCHYDCKMLDTYIEYFSFVLYFNVLYYIGLFIIILYCIALKFTVLYCIVLYFTVVYCILLYCTVHKV